MPIYRIISSHSRHLELGVGLALIIPTNKKDRPCACPFLLAKIGATADLLHFNHGREAAFPAFTAGKVSGSIPLISTKGYDERLVFVRKQASTFCTILVPGETRWQMQNGQASRGSCRPKCDGLIPGTLSIRTQYRTSETAMI